MASVYLETSFFSECCTIRTVDWHGGYTNQPPDPSGDTGVADVRRVREKIAAEHHGDLREHVAATTRIVEPLIEKLGLKEGTPAQRGEVRSGTEG